MKRSIFLSVLQSITLVAILIATSVAFAISQEDVALDFNLLDAQGEVITLSDFKGQAVIINFWATWCPPCLRELPILHEFVQDYPGLPVFLISPTDESRAALVHIGNSGWTSFTGLFDESILDGESTLELSTELTTELSTPKQVAADWRVRGQPVTVVLDTEGIVVAIHHGNLPLDSLETDLLLAGYEESDPEDFDNKEDEVPESDF